MAVDLKALLALRKRRSQRAQDRFAAAERERVATEQAVMQQLRRFREVEDGHLARRNARIQDILDKPTSAVTMIRLGLQYEVGEEEIHQQAERVRAARQEARLATEKVKAAHLELQACLKREKKLEEAINRLSITALRIADVHAEMELER